MPLAPLNNSVVFKKLFRDPQVLQAFLYDLTGLELDIQPDAIETEKRFHPPIGSIDIVMDIVVEDPTHRLLIEIQNERYDYHYDRFLYYHQAATLELVQSYREYKLDRTVYTIVWLTSRIRARAHQRSLITTALTSTSEFGEHLDIYPHKLFFLNPYYHNDHTPAGLLDWLQLVVESITNPQHPTINQERAILSRALTLIESEQLSAEERRVLFEETGYETHLELQRQQGRAEGRVEGHTEGLEEGERRKAEEIARAMLRQGMAPAAIASITGLSLAAVAARGVMGREPS